MPKKSTPKLTQKQKAYDEEYRYWRNRLKRKARNIEKRGFTFPEEFIPDKPNRRLESYIRQLKEKVENIYEYAYYVEPSTGEYFEGRVRRRKERVKAAEKAKETKRRNREFWEDTGEKYYPSGPTFEVDYEDREYWDNIPSETDKILDTVYREIETWNPEPRWSSELQDIKREDVNQLRSIIDGAINQLGREQVAYNLQTNAEEFEMLCMEIMYVSGSKFREDGREGMRVRLNKIASLVWGRALSMAESELVSSMAERFNEAE